MLRHLAAGKGALHSIVFSLLRKLVSTFNRKKLWRRKLVLAELSTFKRSVIFGSLSNTDGDGHEKKKKWIGAVSNFIALVLCRLSRQMLANVLKLNSKGLYQSSRTEKESCCLVFPPSTKHEIRHFNVVVVQRRLRNVQKSVMHVQSCCFANLNLLLFCRSRCRHRRRCLSSLKANKYRG